MPPSMQKSDSTSVRERVLAIERGQQSENSIIRARYVPDVRGVNRYKHFHVVNSSPIKPNGQEKLINPQGSSDLPQLRSTRARPVRNIVADFDNGVEKGRRNKKTTLPQLGPSTTLTRTQKERDICDYIEQQAKSAMTSSDSLSSSATTRSTHSGRKLHDHLTSAHQQQNTPRTFASLGAAKSENDPSTFAEEIDARKSPPTSASEAASPLRLEAEPPNTSPQPSPAILKESATQTLTKVPVIMPEIRGPNEDSCGEGRSTQTDSYPIVVAPPRRGSRDAPVNMEDIEEREALYQVIEDALGETIDRYSRLRTNQIIANSARKQAQIWRDAKDFIANQLVPQSIQMANKSRSRRKTAAEIVASIKCYP
ncbi:hypothetical protein GCK32_000050 [Trichostrongylus colubriformis]|uniref:Uncharacterized protein n=1 Tax=Trichostrongylus colubriformis TaxID=6319 RepID=A0AAN8IMG5_TRICO